MRVELQSSLLRGLRSSDTSDFFGQNLLHVISGYSICKSMFFFCKSSSHILGNVEHTGNTKIRALYQIAAT